MGGCPNILGLEQTKDILRRLESGHLQLSDVEAQLGKMWPNAWETPAYFHILFNALKKGVTAVPQWAQLDPGLRGLGSFCGNRGLRKRFRYLCCGGHASDARMFRHWSGGNFSWRWGKLFIFLFQLRFGMPRSRIRILIERWQPRLMQSLDSNAADERELGIVARVTV